MFYQILALSELTANAYYPLVGLYALLSIYTLLGGWRSRTRVQQVHLIWFLVLPWLLFGGLWYCGNLIWVIFWWLRLGDDGLYDQYARWSSLGVALCISGLVFVRLATGCVSRWFLRASLAGALILIAAMSSLTAWDFTQRIYGWSARGAAENFFAEVGVDNNPFIAPGTSPEIIEVKIREVDIPSPVRRFELRYGKARIHQVNVAPYGRWWWTVGGSRSLSPDEILTYTNHYRDEHREEAIQQLEALIQDFPNHEAARRAEATLRELRGSD
jgi:hypothetical protein